MKGKDGRIDFLEISIEIQQKFEFYFIALIFTILGLTVQSATFTMRYYQFWFEMGAWLCLFTSSIFGLLRIEKLYKPWEIMSSMRIKKDILESINDNLKEEPIAVKDVREYTDNFITKKVLNEMKIKHEGERYLLAIEQDKINKEHKLQYKIMKGTFVLGIVSLVISRFLLNLSKMFHP